MVSYLLGALDVRCEELIVHFVSKKKICDLHEKFFDDLTETDCITFPIDQEASSPYRVLGEIFICPRVAVAYAKAHRIDPYKEVSLYVIHGILHLLGFDDLSAKERKVMRRKENECLTLLERESLLLKKKVLYKKYKKQSSK